MCHPDRRIISFERRRAELLRDRQGRPAEPLLLSPFVRLAGGRVRTLDAPQLEHRRRMLDHLNSQSEAAS